MSTAIPEKVDLGKYIEMRDERPNIRGRRLPVSFFASAHQVNNRSIAELAYSYTLSEEQVLAALLYYRDHKEEIALQDAAELEQWDEMYQLYGGKKPGQG
jgi:uncharacterized protein (DUF433 family)